MDVAVSSCDTHRPVSVYPPHWQCSSLICLSLSGFTLQPWFICVHPSQRTHIPQSCAGLFHRDADMSARPMLPMRGRVSVTKLADEACDIFKGMPKSQHPNMLELMKTHLHGDVNVWEFKWGQNNIFIINKQTQSHLWIIYVLETILVLVSVSVDVWKLF